VAAADLTIAEPPNEIAAGHAKRSDALQNESAYRYFCLLRTPLESPSKRFTLHPVVVPELASRLDPAL
jgi:hypothetical protein